MSLLGMCGFCRGGCGGTDGGGAGGGSDGGEGGVMVVAVKMVVVVVAAGVCTFVEYDRRIGSDSCSLTCSDVWYIERGSNQNNGTPILNLQTFQAIFA